MSSHELTVGIDLNKTQPQLCYYLKDTDSTVAASMRIGNEDVSCRDILEELELIGMNTDDEEDSARIEELEKQMAEIFRRAFATMGINEPAKQIAGMVITVPELTRPLASMIHSIYDRLGIDRNRTSMQDYKESFYYHTLYQKKELWNRNVGFFHFQGRQISFTSLSMNSATRPITFTATEGITITLKEDRKQWDEQFYSMISASLRQNMYTSIFLMGDTFDRSWAGRSVGLLCKGGRKVYVVDNLFARGACYAAREKVYTPRLRSYMYMGDDLVRSSIGMRMVIQGKETYYPLITAGVNWYEAEKVCECILDGGQELEFVLSPMDSGREFVSRMPLPGLPQRPPKMTRLQLHLAFESARTCVIQVQDLGFGDMYPSGGQIWREVMEG